RDKKNRATFAELCRLDFGFDRETLAKALEERHRTYTADERAAIFNMTYAERQHLALRRTGSIDLDKEGRERARRDRYNAKRRAERAELRAWLRENPSKSEGKSLSGEQSQVSVVRMASIDVRPSLEAVTSNLVCNYSYTHSYNRSDLWFDSSQNREI